MKDKDDINKELSSLLERDTALALLPDYVCERSEEDDSEIPVGDMLMFLCNKYDGTDYWKLDEYKRKMIYALCRRYNIEERAIELAPDLYGKGCELDLVSVLEREREEIEKNIALGKGSYRDSLDTSLDTIAKELGETRKSVTKMIDMAIGTLRKSLYNR